MSPRPAGAAMEPCGGGGRLAELRREAAEYYRGHRVPQRMEEALNALFPLCPADLYGALVPPGGPQCGRRPLWLLLREAAVLLLPLGGRRLRRGSPRPPTCP